MIEEADETDALPAKEKNRGHMFLVDVPTYAAVCNMGNADAAAAYLILAAGTGADNRTSTWSREAVKKRTALNWRHADAAIAKLEQHGLARWISGKSTRKPRIDLPPIETRPKMQKHVAAMADRIMHGEQPVTASEKGAATIGKDQGWLAQDGDGTWRFIADRPMVKAYLPMSLVGDEKGKPIPGSTMVERIRMSRDHMAFRLLVDLYALQDLAEHGGVDRFYLEKKLKREPAGRTGALQIWKFSEGQQSVRVKSGALEHHKRVPTKAETEAGKNHAMDIFPRIALLEDAEAIEWVYYMAEDESEAAIRIYPVAVERHGKLVWTEIETIVGGFAVRAACALNKSPEDAQAWERAMPTEFLLPADRLARQATLVGVPRLRHRAKTTNTARWRKDLVDEAAEAIAMFRGIINEHAPELLPEADRRLADFNGTSMMSSTKTSTLVQRDINDSSWSGKHEGFRPSDGDGTATPLPHDWPLEDNDFNPIRANEGIW